MNEEYRYSMFKLICKGFELDIHKLRLISSFVSTTTMTHGNIHIDSNPRQSSIFQVCVL